MLQCDATDEQLLAICFQGKLKSTQEREIETMNQKYERHSSVIKQQ